ncbi:hypothetical protein CB1_000149007 [Camelus ferus]|nr:hypothetical protein CB1_000149007 [Camelus ferus]
MRLRRSTKRSCVRSVEHIPKVPKDAAGDEFGPSPSVAVLCDADSLVEWSMAGGSESCTAASQASSTKFFSVWIGSACTSVLGIKERGVADFMLKRKILQVVVSTETRSQHPDTILDIVFSPRRALGPCLVVHMRGSDRRKWPLVFGVRHGCPTTSSLVSTLGCLGLSLRLLGPAVPPAPPPSSPSCWGQRARPVQVTMDQGGRSPEPGGPDGPSALSPGRVCSTGCRQKPHRAPPVCARRWPRALRRHGPQVLVGPLGSRLVTDPSLLLQLQVACLSWSSRPPGVRGPAVALPGSPRRWWMPSARTCSAAMGTAQQHRTFSAAVVESESRVGRVVIADRNWTSSPCLGELAQRPRGRPELVPGSEMPTSAETSPYSSALEEQLFCCWNVHQEDRLSVGSAGAWRFVPYSNSFDQIVTMSSYPISTHRLQLLRRQVTPLSPGDTSVVLWVIRATGDPGCPAYECTLVTGEQGHKQYLDTRVQTVCSQQPDECTVRNRRTVTSLVPSEAGFKGEGKLGRTWTRDTEDTSRACHAAVPCARRCRAYSPAEDLTKSFTCGPIWEELVAIGYEHRSDTVSALGKSEMNPHGLLVVLCIVQTLDVDRPIPGAAGKEGVCAELVSANSTATLASASHVPPGYHHGPSQSLQALWWRLEEAALEVQPVLPPPNASLSSTFPAAASWRQAPGRRVGVLASVSVPDSRAHSAVASALGSREAFSPGCSSSLQQPGLVRLLHLTAWRVARCPGRLCVCGRGRLFPLGVVPVSRGAATLPSAGRQRCEQPVRVTVPVDLSLLIQKLTPG